MHKQLKQAQRTSKGPGPVNKQVKGPGPTIGDHHNPSVCYPSLDPTFTDK
jgi:hypothetical protein